MKLLGDPLGQNEVFDTCLKKCSGKSILGKPLPPKVLADIPIEGYIGAKD